MFAIINYIHPGPFANANFTVCDKMYPGRLYWRNSEIGTGTWNPYQGEIILLFDERTQSHAEYTCMALEVPGKTTKIGSQTAGADGNVSYIYLPGRIATAASFLGVYYPDFRPTQRIGIVPDLHIRPTIQAIREGRDEVMEAALNCDIVSPLANGPEIPSIQIIPNPADSYFQIHTEDQREYQVRIFDMMGRVLLNNRFISGEDQVQIQHLRPGTYIIELLNGLQSSSHMLVKH